MEFLPMKCLPSKPTVPHTRGAALLIVLASLVFLAALALAFLASIGTELKSSKQYADGVTAKLLSQSAFNLATDQIVEATKGYTGPDPSTPGQPLAWASQPGMIRTYDTSGNKAGYFKLYSWDIMQGSGAFDPSSPSEAISPTWYNDSAIYTDLNKPVKVSGTFQYPIVDGNSLASNISDSTGAISISGKTYDSNGDGKWDIEGFNISSTAPVESGTTNPVPMPVKWLYVLENGQILSPSGGTGNSATFSGANKPTSTNPIVGRVAFWTDDETTKININTASEGVYWDTPRSKAKQEDAFKVNQPVNGEYQRYPGHPAMTSLSTVIKPPSNWTPGTSAPTINLLGGEVNFTLSSPQWTTFQWAQKLYGLAPRIGTGGSNAGTIQTAMFTPPNPPSVALDGNRLYASVDELLFKPDRDSNNTELGNLPVLDGNSLERARFFLTTSSRAPDVNLFNKPRVSIWPITLDRVTGTPAVTAYDELIKFCTTLGSDSDPYYFTRKDPNSPTVDLPAVAPTGLGRNRTLLNYLNSLGEQNIPGFGGNFAAKYPLDKPQIFTQIFDYIRGATNLFDMSDGATTYTVGSANWFGTTGRGQVVPIEDAASSTRGFGRFPTVQGASVLFIGQIDGDDPLVPRDPTTHASIPPYPSATSQVDIVSGKPLPIYSGSTAAATIVTPAIPPGQMKIQAMFIPQFFCPSVGSTWFRQNFQWSVDLSDLRLNGVGMSFPAETKYSQNAQPVDGTGLGDQLGINQAVQAGSVISASFNVPKGTFSFGGKATVKIWAPGASGALLQTIVLNFDTASSPVPQLAPDQVYNNNPSANFIDSARKLFNFRSFGSSTKSYNNGTIPDPIVQPAPPITNPDTPFGSHGGRIKAGLETENANGWIVPQDTIRSVRVVAGDTRLVAAQTMPPELLFEVNPATERVKGAHNFFTGRGQPYYGASLGRLVQGASYQGYPSNGDTFTQQNLVKAGDVGQSHFGVSNGNFSAASDIPFDGVAAGKTTEFAVGDIPGDWDNAPFDVRDGPFINKPDEGDMGSSTVEPYSWKFKSQASGAMNSGLFTPNRQVPSAVTFGSLSTGVKANKPWQTLLFRPEPGHPGAASPADHLMLDLFHMPVVEPYAISEPLSTAGRINMNHQIVPFTYINRDTGIRALLKSEKVISIKDSQAGVYKYNDYSVAPLPSQSNIRLDVNAEETLKGFTQRFDSKDIFRSASEICDLYIVPVDPGNPNATYANMTTYWRDSSSTNGRRLTGDNSKERIYATLYPRLTTKSNTFTIHAKVQTLKKVPGGSPDVWVEGKDQVTGEYRGSQTIERYADPNNSAMPDYSNPSVTTPISSFYKTRVIASKQFAP